LSSTNSTSTCTWLPGDDFSIWAAQLNRSWKLFSYFPWIYSSTSDPGNSKYHENWDERYHTSGRTTAPWRPPRTSSNAGSCLDRYICPGP
jgi:hypothetical protein